MPLLSQIARHAKLRYFFRDVPAGAAILEVGCGGGWLGRELRRKGFSGYTGIDLQPPADIVGDIRNWRELALPPASFDVLVAFEVVEHGDFFDAFDALLKPGGRLFLTSPVPRMDGFLRALEWIGLNQKRTSPHSHLIDLRDIDRFQLLTLRRTGGLSQWGILTKPSLPLPASR